MSRSGDKEAELAARRQKYAAARDVINARRRQKYAANRDTINAKRKAQYAGGREQEYNRRYKAANLHRARERYHADLEDSRATQRRKGMITRHGREIFDWLVVARLAQDGRCYLCGDILPASDQDVRRWRGGVVHVDHDHRCCPRNRSCGSCRRGLACDRCNVLIGTVNDDPALLRRIADNLEEALRAVDARLAEKPEQLSLEA